MPARCGSHARSDSPPPPARRSRAPPPATPPPPRGGRGAPAGRVRDGSGEGPGNALSAPRTWRADTTPAPAPRPVVSAMCTMREVRSRKRVVCRSANWATDASDATETRVMPAGGAVWYSRSSTLPTGSSDSSSAASVAATPPPPPAPRAGRAASSDADVATPRAVAASIRHRSDRSGVEEEREREKPRGERPAAASTGRTGTCDSPSAERICRSREAKPWTAAASAAVVTLLTRGAPRCRRVSRCARGVVCHITVSSGRHYRCRCCCCHHYDTPRRGCRCTPSRRGATESAAWRSRA